MQYKPAVIEHRKPCAVWAVQSAQLRGAWVIMTHTSGPIICIGRGETAREAWYDAYQVLTTGCDPRAIQFNG